MYNQISANKVPVKVYSYKWAKMAAVKLTISGGGDSWQIEPNPNGTIIGRSAACDVVLDSQDISRKHIRISQDPFQRWIVEDLKSSNGTFMNGNRIEASAIMPGDSVVIGPFSLSITQVFDKQVNKIMDTTTSTNVAVNNLEEEIVVSKEASSEALPQPCLKLFNKIIERLSELTSLSALYPEVCQCLAQTPKTVAAVVRLPEKNQPLPQFPQMLVCHFGDAMDRTISLNTSNLRLSRRALEAARSTGHAVMAQSVQSGSSDIVLTVVDEHSPRAVLCAPLSEMAETVDLLYMDIPLDRSSTETFELIRAVSQQVILTRKSLVLMQVKAERSVLDHQLSMARDIQLSLTPDVPDNLPGTQLALHYKPAMWVGGDYCDIWTLEDGRLIFSIGDVSGKGLPAAMVMSNLQAALRTTMSFHSDPAEAMKHVNTHLIRSLPDRIFITLFLGIFEPATGKLEYINAGHLLPVVVRPGPAAAELGEPCNPVLGLVETDFQKDSEIIGPDSGLLIFTDGITEARSPDGDEYGEDAIVSFFNKTNISSAGNIISSLVTDVENFIQSASQQDDITVFALYNSGSPTQ